MRCAAGCSACDQVAVQANGEGNHFNLSCRESGNAELWRKEFAGRLPKHGFHVFSDVPAWFRQIAVGTMQLVWPMPQERIAAELRGA